MIDLPSRNRPRASVVLWAALAAALLAALVPIAAATANHPSTGAPLLSDDFARDSQLSPSLWEVGGPAGLNFSAANCPACTVVPIAPTFSSDGMDIATINASSEIGTIQSRASFSPPFTVNVTVEGTVSNGHPFVFGITALDAATGVQITGNLNPDDCSNETNCGDASTCGLPANTGIAANQCFYGIYARVGTGGANWAKTPALARTPSIGVDYTLEISVDTAGLAQFNVSQGGLLLGASSGQVGDGPFFLILGQSEGAPVPGPGPNAANWISALVTPTAPPPPPGTSASLFDWTLVLVVVA